MHQKWGFSPICDPPRFFFKNRALSLLYPYGALTSCKKVEKNNERYLRYLKTDHGQTNGPRTNGQGRLLRTPSGKPRVQNDLFTQISVHEITASYRSLSGTISCVTNRIRFLPVTMTDMFSNFNSISYTEDRHEIRVTGTNCRLPDTMS